MVAGLEVDEHCGPPGIDALESYGLRVRRTGTEVGSF
jgi:hypothetical protein